MNKEQQIQSNQRLLSALDKLFQGLKDFKTEEGYHTDGDNDFQDLIIDTDCFGSAETYAWRIKEDVIEKEFLDQFDKLCAIAYRLMHLKGGDLNELLSQPKKVESNPTIENTEVTC